MNYAKRFKKKIKIQKFKLINNLKILKKEMFLLTIWRTKIY